MSHDAHLVEMVADRLWLVENGHVFAFDGDMMDYKKWLLAKRGGAGTVNANKAMTKSVDKQLSAGRQRRQNSSAVRAKIRSCETELETLSALKQIIETKMASPEFYDPSNARNIAALINELASINAKLSAVEEAWLLYQEELEQVTKLGA